MSSENKAGMWFATIYLLSTIGVIAYSNSCSEMFCGMLVTVPLFPWLLILENLMDENVTTYLLIVILNSSVFYLVGFLTTFAIRKLFSR